MDKQLELTNDEIIGLQKQVLTNPADKELYSAVTNKLIESFDSTCKIIVNTYFAQYSKQDKEDLLQEAYIVLLKCFLKYDADNENGATFKTYFSTYVRKELICKCYGFNNITKISKNILVQASKWEKRIEAMTKHMSRTEAVDVIAQEDGVSPKEIERKLGYLMRRNTTTIFSSNPDNNSDTYIAIADSDGNFSKDMETLQRRQEIEKIIEKYCYTELEKTLCKMNFDIYDEGGAMGYTQISGLLGKSTSFVTEKVLKVKKRILANEKDSQKLYELLKNV